MNELLSRINTNNRKLGSLKNYEAVLELTKTVEMDEKLLKNLQDEREELEMVNVKLDQIESTIVGFKHRILSSELSDPETEEIENVINEASALDSALNEHVKSRMRI
jgi:citrate synthase